MESRERIKSELEIKERILKQLEGVYKTSRDGFQKKRVLKEIEEIKSTIKNLKGKLVIRSFEDDLEEEEEVEEEQPASILSFIEVFPFRNDSRDREIDAVISYMIFYEENYLPILCEYYIKLDFNHSIKRDMFYPRFMEIKKILKEYNYELDILNREEYNSIAFYRDKSIVHKIRHRYLLSLDKYFKDLRSFLDILIDDYKTSGNIVLNPHGILSLSEFERNRRLDGYMVIDCLSELHAFSVEFIRFLGMPNF
ncbi:MAG: hypothetical protein AMS17_11495 [Spirochaetes bacterium DG_61]|nr:MAG: hypothetical protein AMS17_11495 [Spirochaetes bacterium DG_61]